MASSTSNQVQPLMPLIFNFQADQASIANNTANSTIKTNHLCFATTCFKTTLAFAKSNCSRNYKFVDLLN